MADTGTALTRADLTVWSIACKREPVIRALAAMPILTRTAIAEASDELNLGRSRIFVLVARYRDDPVTSSLLDRSRGFPKGQRRIAAELDQWDCHRNRAVPSYPPKATFRSWYDASSSPAPSATWCLRHEKPSQRALTIDRERLVAARDGRKAADDRYRPIVGSYTADFPLQIVQMDHTPADIIIVDEHFRKPLGRPTLTLQVDVATRVIPGFYISLESPSATSVGMAIVCRSCRRLIGCGNGRSKSTILSMASPTLSTSTTPWTRHPRP